MAQITKFAHSFQRVLHFKSVIGIAPSLPRFLLCEHNIGVHTTPAETTTRPAPLNLAQSLAKIGLTFGQAAVSLPGRPFTEATLPEQTRPWYIAIEGVIGVGKTTLARMLQDHFDTSLLLEVFEEKSLSLQLLRGPSQVCVPDTNVLSAQPLPATATRHTSNAPAGSAHL